MRPSKCGSTITEKQPKASIAIAQKPLFNLPSKIHNILFEMLINLATADKISI